MNKRSLILWGLVASLMLTACSRTQVVKPVGKSAVQTSSKEVSWKMRQQALARKPAWTLISKVALRYREDHWNFGLNWVQKALNNYQMQIKNPLTGAIIAKLDKTPQHVSLLSDDGKTYRDTDEERLLQRQSGVKLPLKGMQYWVRGLVSPQYKLDNLNLDAQGRPKTIYQAGWTINYSRFLNNRFDAMPTKVIITRDKDDVYLKMIAKSW
ncbi:MAG: lipoprotein insertase outer membrane protein LolB [Cocleimonas sp.]